MARTFTIRQVRERDRDDLISNFFGYYEELKRNPQLGLALLPKKPTLKEEYVWFKNLMASVKRGDEIASVAVVQGKAVALCNIKRRQGITKHVGELGIAIIEQHRGKGIGYALMEDVLKKARGRFEMIELEVFGSNKSAIRLYEKFGFEESGRHINGIKRGEWYTDNVSMDLHLK